MPSENPPRSEMMEVVTTVVATLNGVISALRDEVSALAENEKRGRRRISTYLAVIGLAAAASVTGVVINYSQGQDVKSIVHYISDCQAPDGDCKKKNDDVLAGVVIAISAKSFDSITCVLNTLPEDRTDATIKACRDKHLTP